jgi:hypothetical protein
MRNKTSQCCGECAFSERNLQPVADRTLYCTTLSHSKHKIGPVGPDYGSKCPTFKPKVPFHMDPLFTLEEINEFS